MHSSQRLAVLALFLLTVACRHTADGVKADTKNAVEKTEHGLGKAGQKVGVGLEKAGAGLEKAGQKVSGEKK
jgi:hypothetical protein